ncbi:unknown [Eubacterium sp. CAG:274]|nr:unknown [Eubacterium sp. CAG:274]
MDTLFWNIFEKSGDINAFLAYKDFNELKKDKCNDNKHY